MEIKTVNECIKFRLLRKIKPDLEKTRKSLELSDNRVKKCETIIKLEIYDLSIVEAYLGMFHAARGLLYKEGMQEKSHYAVYIYLKEKHSNKIPLHILNFLNIHRIQRHEAMYGFEFNPTKEDAERALEDARIFIKEIKKVIHG